MPVNNVSQNPSNPVSQKKSPKIIIPFLGSMNLAVTLLVMLAIASVIGTVLKQDQTVQDYVIKFGPFWAKVFQDLGLFHVYGAAWFILVLLFLLLSTATCLTRNTPRFMKDMKQYNERLSFKAYQHQPHETEFSVDEFHPEAAQALLKEQGYKSKLHQRDDGITIAAMKGQWTRLGYFLTHISIIVICVGALLDSNLLLKYKQFTGQLVPETGTIPLNQIPQKSWLGPNNFSFRGTVNVPEGQKTDVLFLPYQQGFLVQKLPFTISVKAFRVRFYDTGKPKSFESDIILTAPELKKPIVTTISVNHPLVYKNYSIFQSSFGDGGSLLNIKVHPLLSPVANSIDIQTAVDRTEPLKTPVGTFKAEFTDFRLFNIVPASAAETAKTGDKMHNNGPSIIFKVRNDQGIAWEYENYMQPNKQQGRWFFMSGIRSSAANPFRYIFIPADAKKTKARFFNFLALVNNPVESVKIFTKAFPKTKAVDEKTYRLQIRLLRQLVNLYRQKGFNGITDFVNKTVPKADRKKVSDYYFNQTSIALQTLYLSVLQKENPALTSQDITKFDKKWFEDALIAISALSNYGPPMYFELSSFKQIQSTGLQITKSPGKDVVFFGSTLLIIGIFFLFYVRQKRIWLAYSKVDKTLVLAGKDTKNLPETAVEFEKLSQLIQTKLVDSQNEKQV